MKDENMEVVIDGIVYVPKQEDAKVKAEPIILEEHYKFEVYPNDLEETMSWEDALKAVKKLGDGWRLPTIEECFIMYRNKVIEDDYYWSSTEFDATGAYSFTFLNGYVYNFNKSNTNTVRGVRSI